MIDRRHFVGAALAAVLLPCGAQQAKTLARIGYLSLARTEVDSAWLGTFRKTLRELGYAEGQNLVIEQRHADGYADRMPALAAELLRTRPDVLVIYGAWHLTGKLPPGTPVVFTVVPDPVAQGLVASLARPGGNLTGFADNHDVLVPKRLELIKQVLPGVTRVAVLHYPNRMSLLQLKTAQAAAPAQGLTLVPVELKGPEPSEVARAFATMVKERVSALVIIAEPTLSANRKLIAESAIKHRLVAIGTVIDWAAAGFLLSYGTNFHDLWRRSAIYADKILKGAKAGDLPVEQPTTFDLVVNLKTAKAIGLTVPRAVLLRADQVIE
jgi:putative tryptophan/tyrosine transport system substrate-binding protein